MPDVLLWDCETRSACDLKKRGAAVYAAHPTTDFMLATYAFDDEPVESWLPGAPLPGRVRSHVESGGKVVGHNISFDWMIWMEVGVRKYGFPALHPEQLEDTMAEVYAMALPGALGNAAAALGLELQKDASGQRIMLQLAQPRSIADDGTLVWWDDEEKFKRLTDYAIRDIETTRQLRKRTIRLSEAERAVWQLDYKINQRGVAVDLPAIDAAIEIVEYEKARLNAEMKRVTGGAVSTCTATGQLGDWIRFQGVDIKGVAKADVLDALAGEDLPDNVRKALLLRQEAAKSSTAKLVAMRDRASADGRVRNTKQYHGAGTGRWAGRGIQTDNYPRPKLKQADIETVIDGVLGGPLAGNAPAMASYIDMMHGSPMDVLSSCLRGFIIAGEGKELVAADFANVEGRVLAWLAGEAWKLQAFRDFDAKVGPDLYLLAASRIFHCPIADAKPHRQIGKVAELALGYQGGVGAFQTMARGYGVDVGDERADQIKTAWRTAHPKIVAFWRRLEDAALEALRNGGQPVTVMRNGPSIKFKVKGSFLWCQLPSGRLLCYPFPLVEEKETSWGSLKQTVTYMGVDSVTKQWSRQASYGGFWAENITQAVARDLLAEALTRLDPQWPVVSHIHDEVVCEVPESAPADTLHKIETEMTKLPEWATGLPIATEGWRGARFRK